MKTIEQKVNELYNELIAYELFTEKELELITCINGYNEETLNDCIYARYGYRDFKQMLESEEKQK